MTAVTVEEATDVTPALLEALAHLVPQLSQSAAPIGETELAEMMASPATRLLVARLASAAKSGDLASAAKSGDLASAAGSGDLPSAAKSGDLARAAKSGDLARAAKSGDLARAAGSGDLARAAGSGDLASAAKSGDLASAAGSGGPGAPIVGTLTLVLFRIPTGVRGWIEDVIVDETARGLGVGEALTDEAIRLAYAAGVRTLDLTSRPSRQAAHRLYSKLGFEVRDTSVYRHKQQR